MTTTTANFRARQRIRKEKAPSFCFARVRALRREILSLRETAVCVCACVCGCALYATTSYYYLFVLLRANLLCELSAPLRFLFPGLFSPSGSARDKFVVYIYLCTVCLCFFFLSLSLPPCLYKPLKCESCAMPEGDNAVFCYVVTSRDLNKEVSCPWKAEVSRLLAELVS